MRVVRTSLFLASCLAALAACSSRKTEPLPGDLIGVWTTDTPRYRDRYLELREDAIVFGTGGGKFETYRIVDVYSVRKGPERLYEVGYVVSERDRATISFYYANGILRLKNQEKTSWQKKRR